MDNDQDLHYWTFKTEVGRLFLHLERQSYRCSIWCTSIYRI